MQCTYNLMSALAALCFLLVSPIVASPVIQARAVQVYVYMSPTPVAVAATSAAAAASCPSSVITATADCPSGCTAAPVAGMIGVATDSWSCFSASPETSWTSVQATSTCSAGSTVHTYTAWGGKTELGCHNTAT